ncbi:hypothetical protein PI125_g9001 [Phytophthora idaei]|nr:hypothetical protein PI125_g9001 [Phytophthora idaei]KAG3157951.1 hypothetical protein PI126_g8060 [Phytophthora idaei]
MDARLPSGGTALLTAVWHKRLAVVRILLDSGANIELRGDFQHWPPLHVAYFSGYIEFVQLIYERVPADKKLSFADLVLAQASVERSSAVYTKVVGNGKIDQKRRNGDTALRIACERGKRKTVEALLRNPSNDVNLVDADGRTPLMSASEHGHTEVVAILLEKGANSNDQLPNGFSALHIACENGHTGVVQLLLDRGASIDMIDEERE